MRTSITPRTRGGGWLKGMAAIAVGAALALSACGGDDDDDSGDDTNVSDEDNADDTSTDEADDSSDEGSGSGEYCDKIEAMGESFAMPDPSDPDAIADMAGTIQEIADVAPDDIKADWETFADAMNTMKDLDLTDPDAAEEVQALTGDLTDAQSRLTDHVMENCGG